ncbi:hypothetical protein CPB83DRAFT_562350 [Crepidotus variabilis]|uniref:F-box domain-containing protein n=1 Tax=Crepidotus variabilis TaxID=179855 RepID=A0A9P6E9V4_9AGAR|nr:hypothetical protein CPB83DRAFT_562350 [Crepidotus variabilis]
MHSALEPPEIALEILSHLHIPRSGSNRIIREARISLLALALTSKHFTNFALITLWWRMMDLTPLFKMLSNFIVSRPLTGRRFGTIQGPFLSNDLERFASYANRIRIYEPKCHSCGLDCTPYG